MAYLDFALCVKFRPSDKGKSLLITKILKEKQETVINLFYDFSSRWTVPHSHIRIIIYLDIKLTKVKFTVVTVYILFLAISQGLVGPALLFTSKWA